MKINEKTWSFVREHADEDVRKVALLGAKDREVDLQVALQQIAGRQVARKKLPSWAAVEGIVYPPHLNMEQCSSEQTARYKGGLTPNPSPKGEGNFKGDSMADLTGGFGVDFYWMSQGFEHRYYVEQNEALCEIAAHNFALLGLKCSVCCCTTATYLAQMPHVSLIFLDPARRNEHGGRTYGIEDCSPNVLELMPQLMEKADRVMLKLSPMLDWRKAVDDVQQLRVNSQEPSQCHTLKERIANVHEVHIVSVDNECKELLLIISKEHAENLRLVCVNNDMVFDTVRTGRTQSALVTYQECAWDVLIAGKCHAEDSPLYLYEPNASIMKAGCFAEVEEQFPVRQISPNSHLFLSDVEIDVFPGRKFQILAISSMNKQELKQTFNEIINQKLTSMESANIAVRNFPMTVDQLRKKLKLKDGGDTYIFATTTASGEHKLLICRKIG
jgi:hypothetical protein